MKRFILFLLVAVCIIHGTIIYTMQHIHVDVYGDTAVLTVYGQMYTYHIYQLKLTGYSRGGVET